MNGHPMLKFLKETGPFGHRMPTIFCPGCGGGQILNYTLNAVDQLIHEDHIDQKRFVFVSGIGCSSRTTSHYLQFDSIWSVHGRAPAVATGAKLGRPELKIIIFTGDGDCAAIGGNHFIHACRRNIDLTFVCVNNNVYGMTGGQVSPTTPLGWSTSTTPYGNIDPSIDLCELAKTAGATSIARWTTAHPQQCIRAIKKGIRKNGTAFIEILSQCPTHMKKRPAEMLKELKDSTVTLQKGKAPKPTHEGKTVIGEFVDIEKPEWLSSYQTIVGISQRKEKGEVNHHPHSGSLGLSPLKGGEKKEHDSAIVYSARNHRHKRGFVRGQSMPSLYINDKYCKGCGLCVEICPTKALETSNEMDAKGCFLPKAKDMTLCKMCHQCILICPDFAINVVEEKEKRSKRNQ